MKVERNEFKVSMGNIQTLSMIPKLMKYQKWRTALRKVVLDFIMEEELKKPSLKEIEWMMAGEINEDTIFESGYDRGRKEEREWNSK